MKKYLKILRKCALFDGIGDTDLLTMLTCLRARVEAYEKKRTIFAEGLPAKYLGVVLSGSVQLVQMDYYGNRSILSGMGVAEVFAEEFACAEAAAFPVTVVANEPSEILLLDCGHILRTCRNHCGFHQQLIFNLMRELAKKTVLFHQRIEITSKRTTRDKLMAYLMLQAQKENSTSFEIPFDRQELADYLEVDRSGLSAEIGKLRREGILESNRKHFRLL